MHSARRALEQARASVPPDQGRQPTPVQLADRERIAEAFDAAKPETWQATLQLVAREQMLGIEGAADRYRSIVQIVREARAVHEHFDLDRRMGELERKMQERREAQERQI